MSPPPTAWPRRGTCPAARTWRFTAQVAQFHLEKLPPGLYDLLVLRQGKETGKLEGIIIREGEETGPVSIFSRE